MKIVLVFGVATTLHAVHRCFSYDVTSKLRVQASTILFPREFFRFSRITGLTSLSRCHLPVFSTLYLRLLDSTRDM